MKVIFFVSKARVEKKWPFKGNFPTKGMRMQGSKNSRGHLTATSAGINL
jgi:hypothetical protein